MKEFEKEPLTAFLRTLSLEQNIHIRGSLWEWVDIFEFINKSQLYELIEQKQLYSFLLKNEIIEFKLVHDEYDDEGIIRKPIEDIIKDDVKTLKIYKTVREKIDFYIYKMIFKISNIEINIIYKYTDAIIHLMYDLFLTQIDDYCSIEGWAEHLNFQLDNTLFQNRKMFLQKKHQKVLKKISNDEYQTDWYKSLKGKLLKNSIQEFKLFFINLNKNSYLHDEKYAEFTPIEDLISSPDFDVDFDNGVFNDFIKYEINTRKLRYIESLINNKKQIELPEDNNSKSDIFNIRKEELFFNVLNKTGALKNDGTYIEKFQPIFDAIWKVNNSLPLQDRIFKATINQKEYKVFIRNLGLSVKEKLSSGKNYIKIVEKYIKEYNEDY